MAQWDRVLRLNVTVPFLLTQQLLPLLTRSATATGSPGRVVNIGSIDGLRAPEHDAFAYAASKAALHHLTQMLAPKLGRCGVLVNALAPSAFETRMSQQGALGDRTDDMAAANPLGRIGQPDDIVGAVVFLASDESGYVNGAVIPVDGGISKRTVTLPTRGDAPA
jgi:NAD(P)-dependent dehydrogenase (short-subunit alcohol dehydrogenase family)